MTSGKAIEEQDDSCPSPNKGYSLSAPDAMKYAGWEQMPLDQWMEREQIDKSQHIKLVRLSHMRYMHSNIESITNFLHDFGMHITKKTDDKIWWRGYGSEPYVYVVEKGPEKKYLGGAWTVESYADLEKYVLHAGRRMENPAGGRPRCSRSRRT